MEEITIMENTTCVGVVKQSSDGEVVRVCLIS